MLAMLLAKTQVIVAKAALPWFLKVFTLAMLLAKMQVIVAMAVPTLVPCEMRQQIQNNLVCCRTSQGTKAGTTLSTIACVFANNIASVNAP
jgi:hypothetical protein